MTEKIKMAFGRIATDMKSVRDWLFFFNNTQRDLKLRVLEIEKKIRKLELERDLEV